MFKPTHALHQAPTQFRSLLRPTLLLAALSAALAAPAAFAFNSGSTGADGALAPTVNTEIQLPPSGILNYTSINIPAGVTVKFKKNALNTPVYLLVSGNTTIAGGIDISGSAGAATGTAGNGSQADDGIPGVGGPGGYDGGRGGKDDLAQVAANIRGGAGLGPGGGVGGYEGADGCTGGRYYKYLGASAGYATSAADAGAPFGCVPDTGGKSYGSTILQPLIGGSGGGGGKGGVNFPGSGGGGGGGALLIATSGTFNITGVINANGGSGGELAGTGAGGAGGAGSGGAVRIMATTMQGNGPINTQFACPNAPTVSNNFTCNLPYFRSSVGRIRIEADAITYTGATTPTYTTDVPGPIFLASLPALRIASVAGTAVPANPTGNADVTLPTDVANPVTITFETTNVPTGNTVLLKMIPAYGLPTEVLSPAIAGTAASGTTSVQVSLPQGPSTLQAITTYTVVVAMGESLSRFAQNERVEKVQLIATLGRGEGQAKLITVSGKEYLVPMSVLQMVGFAG